MRQMRHVKPHSKAVCILAPPCAHMVTARFGQSDRPRLNKSRIRRRRKKALAPCENTGKFPQKHSAKCVKNARRRTTEKLQVASPAPFLLHATFQGERYARYARRTQKNTQNPLCASPAPLLLHATFQGERYARYARRIQKKNTQNPLCASLFKAKTSAKLRLLWWQLNPPYGRRISPERQWFNANLGLRKSLFALSSGAKPGWTQNPFAIKFDPKSVWKLANKHIRHFGNGLSPRQNAMPLGCVFHAMAAPYTPDNARPSGPKKPSDLTVITKNFMIRSAFIGKSLPAKM